MSVNRVFLIGRLGADPELRMAGSAPKVELRLATDESWTDRDGQRQTKVEWHRVVCWRGLAETVAQHKRKGDEICVEGRIQTRSYEKNGETKWITEIVADRVHFIGGRPDRIGGAPTRGSDGPPADRDELPF